MTHYYYYDLRFPVGPARLRPRHHLTRLCLRARIGRPDGPSQGRRPARGGKLPEPPHQGLAADQNPGARRREQIYLRNHQAQSHDLARHNGCVRHFKRGTVGSPYE